jgi:arylsulfatase A-like enzyme
MPNPKSVLFITADQWRGDCLSALNHPVVKTPNLDALAREGVLFARHFANTAPCSPSRATLHTGLYQHNHRVTMNGTPLDQRHTNWALEARKLGYDPALIGYTDQTADPRDLSADDPRLRTYEGILPGLNPVAPVSMDYPGPWADFLRARGYQLPDEERYILWLRENGPDYEDGAPHPKPWIVRAEHNDTTWHVDQAIDYVSEKRGEPWILHLSLLRPHPPWIASEPWNRLYDPANLPPPMRRTDAEQESAQHPWLAHQLTHPLYRAPDDQKKLNRMRAVYFAMISEVDDNLGRLFDHLKHERLWDDMLIVFTSDHGEQLGDHWLLGKCGYFDGSYAVPLIVRHPSADMTRGRTVRAFTEHVDIKPTLLDFIGAETPPQCDGRSLMPFLEAGSATAWRKHAHWEYDFRDVSFPDGVEQKLGLTLHQCNMTIIRDEQFKYVHFAGLAPLLFDVARDPGEFTNLAQDPEYAPVAMRYAQELLSWRLTHEDQTLTHKMATPRGMLERPAQRF